jgi:Domain of unknown function (DUF6532)
MFLHRAITETIHRALFKAKRNYARRTHTRPYTNHITAGMVLLATVGLRHALEEFSGGVYSKISFEHEVGCGQ